MYYVYILRSPKANRYYYGSTSREPEKRLRDHNMGKSSYTKRHRPWILIWYGCFSSRAKAEKFEVYLKTPSGHAFARKRLV